MTACNIIARNKRSLSKFSRIIYFIRIRYLRSVWRADFGKGSRCTKFEKVHYIFRLKILIKFRNALYIIVQKLSTFTNLLQCFTVMRTRFLAPNFPTRQRRVVLEAELVAFLYMTKCRYKIDMKIIADLVRFSWA